MKYRELTSVILLLFSYQSEVLAVKNRVHGKTEIGAIFSVLFDDGFNTETVQGRINGWLVRY